MEIALLNLKTDNYFLLLTYELKLSDQIFQKV